LTSAGVQVTPSIATQPASQTVTAGQTAIFSVTATGAAPLSYQWKKNGTPISNATSPSYTTPSETTSDSGSQFTVVVSNSVGSATSNATTLTVNAGPGGPLQIATSLLANAQAGIQFQASLTATGGAPPYQWSITSGTLPPGLSLNAASGMLSGTPSQGGQFDFSAQVSDSWSPKPQTAMKALTLSVLAFALQITPSGLPNGQVGAPFQTTITGNGGVTPYTWAVTGALPAGLSMNASSGAIAGTPTQSGTFAFTIVLTDSAQQTAQKSSSITILAAGVQPLSISTTTLPNPITGQAYSATLQATGGTPPYTWSVVSGQLPPGLTLASVGGQIVGTSSQVGSSTVSIQASDSAGQTAQKSFSITTAPAGPALPTLPQATVDTTFPNTSAYTVTNVTPGQLQAALNAASCNPNGTILQLPQGSVDNESITMPVKSCAAGQWIIVETAGLTLPSRGQRLDPSQFVGQMAKITQSQTNVYAVQTASNAPSNHYWFIGLEIEHTGTDQGPIFDIGIPTNLPTNFPSYIIVDHCYIHGRATNQISRAVDINGGNIAVVDSYLSENHEVGFEAQGVAGYSSPGPILIQNNFIEGAGQGIFWGGSGIATNQPPYNQFVDDSTIQNNFIYKPTAWKVGDPGYIGIHWTVKNLIEMKEGHRILIQNNVVENNWADAQTGNAVLFTPTQQSGSNTVLQDVTFQNNVVAHASGGFTITGRDATAAGDTMHRTNRILVQNNLFDDLKKSEWAGTGNFMQVSLGVNALTVDHNTVSWIDSQILSVNDDIPETAFSFTNNLVPTGLYGFFVNAGAPNGVSYLTQWLSNPAIANNVAVGFPSAACSLFFMGTQCPASFANVEFVNYNNGSNGDYRLCSGSGTPASSCGGASPYAAGQISACASNTDCGANVAQLQQMKAQIAVFPANGPSISSVSTTSMACNGTNSLTINGTNLNLPGTEVMVNGVIVAPKAQTPTVITMVPPAATGVTVAVAVDNFGLPSVLPLTCQ
jgi:putative Ig domain-containing protein/immunoglobulin I-set domain protein/IPT/TIG domain-containing protein